METFGLNVAGWDQSLKHGAVVLMNLEGELVDYAFLATLARDASRSKVHGARVPERLLKKLKDRTCFQAARMVWLGHWFATTEKRLRAAWGPFCVAIEDYALKMTQGAHYLGEVGWELRRALTKAEVPWRLYDPTTLKMYTTGAGNAPKERVQEEVAELLNERPSFDVLLPFASAHEDLWGDLCDAVALAEVARMEIRVRLGLSSLADMDPKKLRVFQRTTKSYPENMLMRPWVGRNGVPVNPAMLVRRKQ